MIYTSHLELKVFKVSSLCTLSSCGCLYKLLFQKEAPLRRLKVHSTHIKIRTWGQFDTMSTLQKSSTRFLVLEPECSQPPALDPVNSAGSVNKALNSTRKSLVAPVTLMPLFHQCAYLARPVVIVTVFSHSVK